MSSSNKSNPEFGTVAWLRQNWVEYFESQKHKQVKSASLIPAGDPTLLFTTAGMVQFKPYFAGTEKPPAPRVVSIQKCLRTTDLEEVGKTARHCTFFEMLGNFSFGDYFKFEAMDFAWDFSINVLKLDQEKIFVTVYEDDDEAEKYWHEKVGVPMARISRLDKKDNWWGPAGDSGACGPCSELYIDRGPSVCTCHEPEKCGPGSECDRYLEYWNLVFNQFNQNTEGELSPLAQTGIDTGAGLERIAAILNDTDSVYDTDEFAHIIKATEKLTGELREDGVEVSYADVKIPFRVIADHVRSSSFAIADGVTPDSTGRGYVIRRVVRRALLYVRELGVTQPLLYRLIPTVVDIYGEFYPELKAKKDELERIIHSEEVRFLRTLELGLRKWEEFLEEHKAGGAKLFSGERVFKLYDTFGFPPEMTVELAEKLGIEADMEEYAQIMERAKSSSTVSKVLTLPGDLPDSARVATEFTGYDNNSQAGKILALVQNEKSVSELKEGQAYIILDRSCFYAEGGGQMGDHGSLSTASGARFEIKDTRKVGEIFVHIGELIAGSLTVGDEAEVELDLHRRESLMRHHSATHLLNKALGDTLGDHISQTGSQVAPDYLRFDFSHTEKIKARELQKIEDQVNEAISAGAPVQVDVLPIEEAKKKGAVAAFGEKYGDTVRIVSMGDKGGLSLEFCGGTHVPDTGFIGMFHILKEASPGAGNRRIEAVAGERVALYYQDAFQLMNSRIHDFNERTLVIAPEAADQKKLLLKLEVPNHQQIQERLNKGALVVKELSTELNQLQAELDQADKALQKFRKSQNASQSQELLGTVDEALAGALVLGDVKVVSALFENQDIKNLRAFGDALKEKERSAAVLLGNVGEKGPQLMFMANKNAVQAGVHCGNLIKVASGIIGGGGGGRPDMAQAGGKDAGKLQSALDEALKLLTDSVKA